MTPQFLKQKSSTPSTKSLVTTDGQSKSIPLSTKSPDPESQSLKSKVKTTQFE